MMKKLFSLFLLTALCLVGCSEEELPELSQETFSYEFLSDSDEIYKVELPKSLLPVVATDNYYYLELQQGVAVYRFNGTTDEESTPTSYTKLLSDCYLTANYPEQYADTLERCIKMGQVYEPTITSRLYEDYRLKTLPVYDDVTDMTLLDGNMYMPEGSEVNEWGGHVAIKFNGGDFIESFTQDGTIDELRDEWAARLTLNTPSQNIYWYQDDNIFYAECGNNIMCAKKLTITQYYVYFGTSAFSNQMLYGINKIKFGEK